MITIECSEEGLITKATINAHITQKDFMEVFNRSGLIGIYNLGMKHMLQYMTDNKTKGEDSEMLSIDQALAIYSDKIATGEEVNIDEICNQLDKSDRKEFINLAEMVLMTMDLETKSFDEFFGKLNTYKESVYPVIGEITPQDSLETYKLVTHHASKYDDKNI